MKVYHGSYMLIDRIDLSESQPKRDFGQGFYVTKIRSQAEYWAERKGNEKNVERRCNRIYYYHNLPFYPIFNFNTGKALKIFQIVGYERQPVVNGGSAN
ncbi:MAG: DUF3990 domain-containing protein [Dysgonamonadaceae bacterium]|jgi:hypothetical protein|nr:DUF3990 domain-containing protein [Dysgonamonadaceae bacterium]